MTDHGTTPQVPVSAQDLAATSRTRTFAASPASAKDARRHVEEALDAWGLGELTDAAALCTAELTTNAILHSRGEFTVIVRPTPGGVRLDVQDDQPRRLPIPVPALLDPLETGTTGRGLLLVACTAHRWGFFTTDIAKTVWCELAPGETEEAAEPIVEVARRHEEADDVVEFELLDLPVRAAIASGIQVDELVRDAQLSNRLGAAEQARLYDLLDRSAGPRLHGRQSAFSAAARHEVACTVRIAATADEVSAVSALSGFLEVIAAEVGLEAAVVDNEVLAMRAWVSDELATQAAGGTPTPFRYPTT